MKIYSLDVLLSQLGSCLLFYVWIELLLLDLHTDFSGGRSGGLVFLSLEEFSIVCCDLHSQRLWCIQQNRNRYFSVSLLLFWLSTGCCQFYLWFLCFFYFLLEHLEILGLCAVEASFGEFWAFFFFFLLACKMRAVVLKFKYTFTLPFFGIRMKTDLFQSCGHCCIFQICWLIECSTFTASSFRTWNSSAEIPSPPLAFFVVKLPQAHLTSD